jgi:pilus assembly protein Flp/PilA
MAATSASADGLAPAAIKGAALPKLTDVFRTDVFAALGRDERGQTMAEYGVVLALITLAVLAGLTLLSGNISSALTSVANLLP